MKPHLPRLANLVILVVLTFSAPAALAKSVEEIDMVAGRLTKVPVSSYWERTIRLIRRPGVSSLPRFRTACTSPGSDTGMLVSFSNRSGSSATLYNDDGAPQDLGRTPLGNGSGSYIDTAISGFGPRAKVTSYTLIIFSKVRATSACSLYIDRGDGQGWNFVETVRVGGTLVRVGPLSPGDYLQIQKPRDVSPTRMVLFEVKSPFSTHRPIEVTEVAPQNSTVINIQSAFDPDAFVLLGLDGASGTTKRGVEDRVDLVRGPLNESFSGAFPVHGGNGEPIALKPGRYYFFVNAKIDQPVGSGKTNSAFLMNGCTPHDSQYHRYFRGQPNDTAFTMTAFMFGVSTFGYDPFVARRVSRSVMGGIDIYSRIIVEARVDNTSFFYVSTSDQAAGLHFDANWTAVRNPNASELKLVSANMYYDDLGYTESEYRNAANLFATRGTVIPPVGGQAGRVEESPDQAPFQLEADTIAMQEVVKKCVGGDCYKPVLLQPFQPPQPFPYYPAWDYYERIFATEAESRGTLRWNFVTGRDEYYEQIDTGGKGPILVNSNNWPDQSDPNSMYFSTEAKRASNCQYSYPLAQDSPGYAECVMSGGDFYAYYRAIPAKIAIHRFHTDQDRPVAVFNVHPSADGLAFTERSDEFSSLIDRIRALLGNDPRAFSPSGSPDDVRMIVMGDFNTQQRECGEQYWTVNKFREAFGYAVEVSMAVDGSVENYFSAHDQGAYDSNGIPVGWESFDHWKSLGAPLTPDSRFPWWSMSTRGMFIEGITKKDSAELLDHIVLVGKGWAKDDAVRAYSILSDRHDISPMDSSGRAIEMWRPMDLSQTTCSEGVVRNGDPKSYNTNYALDPARAIGVLLPPCGVGRGKPALHTDHRPITATLRIF